MKNLKGFCLDIAKADRQQEILYISGNFSMSGPEYSEFERQVYAKAFSAENKAIFQKRRAAILEVLQRMNGRKWNDVLKALKTEAVSHIFLGFKVQDKLIELCEREGLRYE